MVCFDVLAEARLETSGLFLVMAFDLLLGQGLRGGGQLRRRFDAAALRLRRAWASRDPPSAGAGGASEVGWAALPRYVRVNGVKMGKTGKKAVLKQLRKALKEKRAQELQEGKEVEPEVAEVKDW
eukprot:g9793.t1